MYSYRPQQNRKPVYVTIAILILAGMSLFASAVLSEFTFKYINISAGAMCFVIILLLSQRFINTSYVYCIDMIFDGYVFYITENTGKNKKVVCKIMLSDIEKIIYVERKRKKDKKLSLPKSKAYNYCASLFEIKRVILYIEEKNELVGIILTFDERMVDMIKEITQIS